MQAPPGPRVGIIIVSNFLSARVIFFSSVRQRPTSNKTILFPDGMLFLLLEVKEEKPFFLKLLGSCLKDRDFSPGFPFNLSF